MERIELRAVAVALLCASAAPVGADVLSVPGDFTTIRAAVGAAVPGDVIQVGPGTWREAVVLETPQVTLRGAGIDATILDGAHTLRPVTVSARAVVVEDLTIRNGYAPSGGGLAVESGSCRVEDVAVRGCSNDSVIDAHGILPARSWGGGIFAAAGTNLSLIGVTLADNVLWAYASAGGGLAFLGESLEMRACLIADNTVDHEGRGAGIFAAADNVFVEDCTFLSNGLANGNECTGGGLYVEGDRTRVVGCTFTGNVLSTGVGISARIVGSDAEVTWCEFTNNGSVNAVGNLSISGARCHVHDCVFDDNWVEYRGAGVFDSEDGLLERVYVGWNNEGVLWISGGTSLRDVWVDDFRSQYGDSALSIGGSGSGTAERLVIAGGSDHVAALSAWNCSYTFLDSLFTGVQVHEELLDLHSATISFEGCAFVDNPDGWWSDGEMRLWNPVGGSSVTFRDSILWNPELTDELAASPQVTVTTSNVRGGAAGTGNLDVDPGFVGGSDDPLVAYRLAPGSPLIDAGSPATPGLRLDLARGPRRIDGDLDGSARVDVGPFEFTETHLTEVTPEGGPLRMRLEGPVGGLGLVAAGAPAAALPLGQFGALFFGGASGGSVLAPLAAVPFEVELPPLTTTLVVQGLVFVGAAGQTSNPLRFTP